MDFRSRSIHLMGTTITISILHPQAGLLLDEVIQLLFLYEKRFSANDDASELMKINHQAGKRWVQVLIQKKPQKYAHIMKQTYLWKIGSLKE